MSEDEAQIEVSDHSIRMMRGTRESELKPILMGQEDIMRSKS
jgi:hypothetical protein